MIPTMHPVSIVFQVAMVGLEFWAIGQFHKHPLRFALGMVGLNVLACIFYVLTGSYILAPVCVVMGFRHAQNARRILNFHDTDSRRVLALLEKH